MLWMRKSFLPLISLLLCFSASAQRFSNLHEKIISLKVDTVQLDSVSIVPNSFFIMNNQNKIIDTAAYVVDVVHAKLVWKKNSSVFSAIKNDSVRITYRTFPFLFSQSFQHKDYSKLKASSGTYNPFYYSPSKGDASLFKFDGLTKAGSISRGITFGNSQDVFVNSSLNLQLAGKISDDVEILAAITDDNVPIQPEGNTQQLQEFDKVFIQLSNENNKLIAGDFNLTRPDSYFMNFFKRGQGGLFSSKFRLGKNKPEKKPSMMSVTASGAVSKGKFARNTIIPLEGNQGPYRLTGSNNETFIIVLAGSEKIFLDGQRMTRGTVYDYTIDYNAAQITFTPKRLITKDSRIVVEFEYSERSYGRSLIYFNNEFEKDKLRIKFNLYSEQDSKNQPLQIQLDSSQKEVMNAVGDRIELAYYPTYDSVAFNTNQILYQKKDTIDSTGTYFDVFVYSTNSENAHWQVTFSSIGQGKGDYIQDFGSVNGKVYKWVRPVNGVPQGSYAPVALLITPKKQQLFTLGGDYSFSKKNTLRTEIAMSNYDINLFSTKDKENDAGYATKLIYENTTVLKAHPTNAVNVQTNLNYEYVNKNFKPLERFRTVEFDRDWNTGGATSGTDEHISSFQSTFSKQSVGSIHYQLNSYIKGTDYKGLMNAAGMNLRIKKIRFTGNGSYLNTTGSIKKTHYYKHNVDISYPFWKLVIGGKENTEHNEFLNPSTDLLYSNSFIFQEYGGYIGSFDTAKTKVLLSYKKRYDKAPVLTSFKTSTIADEMNLSMELLKNPGSQLRTNSTFRKLSIEDTLLTQQVPVKTFLNRIDYYLNLWKGAVTTSTYYEVGGGQERRLEYYFLKVPIGQGTYIYYGDVNDNGIQELDEFEVAAFAYEADYIKVYTPTDQYIATRTNQFSEVLTLSPAAIMQPVQGKQKIIARFTNQLSVRLDKKTQNEELLSSLNPFNQNVNDSSLVSNNSNFRNTLFFNRSSAVYGVDVTWQQNKAKSLLTNGFESRIQTIKEVNLRWNLSRSFLANASYQQGGKQNQSDFFSTRDYNIISDAMEPKLTFQPNVSFRTILSYKYSMKENVEGSVGERAISNNIGLEVKYNAMRTGSLTAKFNLFNISYNADENTSISYDMMEGLRKGKNATWNLSIQRNLSNSLQISFNYDGRKSEDSQAIHTGGIQFRAFF